MVATDTKHILNFPLSPSTALSKFRSAVVVPSPEGGYPLPGPVVEVCSVAAA